MGEIEFKILAGLTVSSGILGLILTIFSGTQINLNSRTNTSIEQTFIAGICLMLASFIGIATYALSELHFRMTEQKLKNQKPTIMVDSPVRKSKSPLSSNV